MRTRYIKKGDKLYYAMVIDGKYRRPISTKKFLSQPQYVILSQKKNLYEIMYYNFYQAVQALSYLSPAQTKQLFIPFSHVVNEGDVAEPEVFKDDYSEQN